jgi:aryl-alcohol dehydrogenase-like predicted oxidoreductase
MDMIHIGRSDLVVPRLGVGAMTWSDSPGREAAQVQPQTEAAGAFHESVAAGVRFFDTAEIYGWGSSERVVGSLVRSEPERVVIASKYAPLPNRFSARSVSRALEASLERLGMESLDLYQVHFPFSWLGVEGLMGALADAVAAGKIRYVGVSNYSAAQMRRAHEALARRGVPLVSNQVEYSLVRRDPERNGVLAACRELEITLIAYSPLGRGLLTGKYRPGSNVRDGRRFYRQFRGRNLARLMPLVAALEEIGQENGGKTPAQVALNWLMRQPEVLPIPGARNAKQARQNAGATGWEMTPEEAGRLDRLSRTL